MEELVKQKCEAIKSRLIKMTDDQLPLLLKEIRLATYYKRFCFDVKQSFNFDNYELSDIYKKSKPLAEEEDHLHYIAANGAG